ncbi:hypothetical protein LTS15_001646 [Exophiala xenobiotica]|nr:hypothetical protein LTS15_001646 [Exophiala xenobiotica]
MVTGIETGVETLKGLRNKRYRRQLEEYSTRLGNQQTILLNNLEHALEGVVDYEDEICELINNPRGSSWKDPAFQEKLRRKLDRNYNAFVRTTTELSWQLEHLSRRLGLESSASAKKSWNDATAVEREFKKFKDVFSKSIYSKLLSQIENANSTLQILIGQSRDREVRKKHRVSNRPLLKYRNARTHATNLYNAITRGKCWSCPCKASHCVHLRIEPPPLDDDDGPHRITPVPLKLRIAFASKTTSQMATPSWHWQEVETIPVVCEAPARSTASKANPVVTQHANKDRMVKFAIVTSALDTVPWPKVDDITALKQISDMCSALHAQNIDDHLIGSILDDIDPSQGYNLYLMDEADGDVPTQSLGDLLGASAGNNLHFSVPYRNFMLSRRDRMFLAATLASSVLQFQGTWLKPEWRSHDILFRKATEAKGGINAAMIDRFYLSGHEVGKEAVVTGQHASQSPTQTSNNAVAPAATNGLIRCALLFPLALSLIELSLCQQLSSLRSLPEDADPVEAVSNLKTATRVLDQVRTESGCRYREAVEKCLFWTETNNMKLDDEEFQRAVFDMVVSPLLDDLRDFEGRGRIR